MLAVIEAPPSVDSSSTKIGIPAFSVAGTYGEGVPSEGGTILYVIRAPRATRFARDLIKAVRTRTPLQRPAHLKERVREMPRVDKVPDDWAESLAADLARLSD